MFFVASVPSGFLLVLSLLRVSVREFCMKAIEGPNLSLPAFWPVRVGVQDIKIFTNKTPTLLADDHPMMREEPRSHKTAAGEPVEDEGSQQLSIDCRGLRRCSSFRVAIVHRALA